MTYFLMSSIKTMKEALLIIDPQKIYALDDSALYVKDYKIVVENINKLIALFQRDNKPIIYIRHIHDERKDSGRMFDYIGKELEMGFVNGTQEVEYMDELKIDNTIPEIIKKRYSSFVGTTLEDVLHKNQISCVMITGFMTNFCCETTARHAHDKDYYVKFILDATGAPALPELDETTIKKSTAANISNGFGNVYNTTDILKKNNF